MARLLALISTFGPTRARVTAVIAIVTCIASSAGPTRADMLWPLQAAPAISSGFGEHRDGHFHAGIDARTYGKEGVPCLAAGEGYVSRIRTSPEGYGKVVYVQLTDGYTLVYAHLSEFSPELEAVLYEAQRQAGEYTLDLRFARDRFVVRRGDVIGYSGSTGGTAPHLHFEVRDPGENPVNPLLHGLQLADGIPPSFERVVFEPLSERARINGTCWPVEYQSGLAAPGEYVLADTLYLQDDVGVAAEIADRLSDASGLLGPYGVTLEVDGDTIADIRLESFDFSHTEQVYFLYDPLLARREGAYVIQLFESEGEALWNRKFDSGGRLGRSWPSDVRWKEAPDSAVHVGKLFARDCAGNSARLTFRFFGRLSPPVPRRAWERALAAARPPEIPGVFVHSGFVSSEFAIEGLHAAEASRPDSLLAAGVEGYTLPNVYTAAQLSDGPTAIGTARDPAYVVGLRGGESASLNFPELGLQVVAGVRSLYGDAVLFAARGDASAKKSELVPRVDPVRIGPSSLVLQADVEIRFACDRADTTTAVYRLREATRDWVFCPSTVDRRMVSAVVRCPGVYAVFADRHGPRIRRPFVSTWKSYATGETEPEIVVPIEDSGSDVDHQRTVVTLSGTTQIARWDPQAKKLFVRVRDPHIMGSQSVSIECYDRAGNRSHRDETVEILRKPRPEGND
jgi:hypothetical protein